MTSSNPVSARHALSSPGWPEVAVALITYVTLVVTLSVLWMLRIPDEQAALRGIFGMAMNGIVGCIALLAAYLIRIRNLSAFGFRETTARWLLIGAVFGVAAFFLSLLIEHIYFSFITEANTQADFQAAAKAGLFSLLVLVFSGAILTPFGEEVVFRGVIANALNRYGAWAGIVGSALIFAAVHGPSVIFFNAFMAGILTGYLFRKTDSVWPGLVTHVVYNAIWLVVYGYQ
ncbi:MAG: CPBP family intramembrane metalloprotease [Hyphomicrobium sp.]|nr:CPBP family intramembrane metalloprotease [Hyphomicrobium sp.]